MIFSLTKKVNHKTKKETLFLGSILFVTKDMKPFFILAFLFCSAVVFAQSAAKTKPQVSTGMEAIWKVVDTMPKFRGGQDSLNSFFARTLKYPALAQENKVEGKVIVKFVVTKKGEIAYAKVVTGVSPELDKEALRVVNLMPRWIPGKQKGTPVNVMFTLPVNFSLNGK
jgi:TonB family protein